MILNEQLLKDIKKDETILQVFDLEDLTQEWHHQKRKSSKGFSNQSIKKAANFVSPLKDSATAIRICKDLGLNGQYVIKTVGKKQYVIFKGYPGQRTILTGTRYLATNKKVVKMAIGRAGINSSIRFGGALTIVLFTGIEVIKWVIDGSTLSQLAATVATDMIKVGLGCIAAKAATLLVGCVTTAVAGPLVVAIVACVVASGMLNYIDEQYGLTAKLAAALSKYGDDFARKKDALEKSLGRKIHDTERELIYRIYRFDIDNPLGFAH